MCSNYVPVTAEDRLLTFFGVDAPGNELREGEVFPAGTIPIIRIAREGDLRSGERTLDKAVWRFVPPFIAALSRAKKGIDGKAGPADPPWAKNTFNARSEELLKKPTFAKAWRDGQRCILPTERFFEPRYYGTVANPGKSNRWRIQQVGGVPLGIAGIYRRVTDPETGELVFAAAMLTVNADGHPIMSMFHRPGDEKRMPVILDPEDYARWLECSVEEAAALCKQWHGPLEVMPDLLPGQVPPEQQLF